MLTLQDLALSGESTEELAAPLFSVPPLQMLDAVSNEIAFYDVETTIPAYGTYITFIE
jgi:hypothetical protein